MFRSMLQLHVVFFQKVCWFYRASLSHVMLFRYTNTISIKKYSREVLPRKLLYGIHFKRIVNTLPYIIRASGCGLVQESYALILIMVNPCTVVAYLRLATSVIFVCKGKFSRSLAVFLIIKYGFQTIREHLMWQITIAR